MGGRGNRLIGKLFDGMSQVRTREVRVSQLKRFNFIIQDGDMWITLTTLHNHIDEILEKVETDPKLTEREKLLQSNALYACVKLIKERIYTGLLNSGKVKAGTEEEVRKKMGLEPLNYYIQPPDEDEL